MNRFRIYPSCRSDMKEDRMRFPWSKPKPDAMQAAQLATITAQEERAALVQDVATATVAEIARAVSGGIGDPNNLNNLGLMSPNLTPDGTSHGIYKRDNPYNWSIPQPPTRRPGSSVSLETLRALADNYDPLRAAIQHLKREVMTVPLTVVAKDSKDKSRACKRAIADATEFLSTRGGLGGIGSTRAEFESSLIDDLSIIGVGVTFYTPNLGGGIYTVEAIDAATIRPRVDAFGWPGPGEAAFEQWVLGILIGGYTREQMDFRGAPTNTRTFTPYPASPVEWLINALNSALRADDWNRQWLVNGNTPADVIALPENWTPPMIKEFSEFWEMTLSGDSSARQKTKFAPSGSQRLTGSGRKDQDFEVFELWLMRRVMSVMGVQPASVGYAGEQYKNSQADSMESTSNFGVGVLLAFFKSFYDDLFVRLGYDCIEASHIAAREEDATERAKRNFVLTGVPIKTINEARTDEGLGPVDGGDVLLVPYGTIPLEQALQPPTDPNADPSADPNAKGGDSGDSGQGADAPVGDPFNPTDNSPDPTNRLQRGDVEFINKDGHVIPLKPGGGGKGAAQSSSSGKGGGGKGGSKGPSASPADPNGTPAQESPPDSARVMRAKQSSVLVDKEIQRYSEEHNEPQLAKGTGGLSLVDNEPVDVMVLQSGIMQHGIELKTMVSNKADKITMKKDALQRKKDWQEKNFAPMHTVVFDDKAVFNANGPGQHDDSKRQIYYRRGAGSFRIAGMQPVKDMAELNTLLNTPSANLPGPAKPGNWPEPPARTGA
jgi:hypothetical protein